jgi:hypothetical protein
MQKKEKDNGHKQKLEKQEIILDVNKSNGQNT